MKWFRNLLPFDDDDTDPWNEFLTMLAVILISLCVSCIFTSCRSTTNTIEVERVSHDTLYRFVGYSDTTVVKDSIVLRMLNDTIHSEKWHTVYKYIQKHDTVYKTRIDTIPTIVTIEVEKKLTWWQEFKQKTYITLGILCLVSMLCICVYIVRRFF